MSLGLSSLYSQPQPAPNRFDAFGTAAMPCPGLKLKLLLERFFGSLGIPFLESLEISCVTIIPFLESLGPLWFPFWNP